MNELTIILTSGVAGGFLTQIGGRLIEKLIKTPHEKRELKKDDIIILDSKIDLLNKIIDKQNAIIDRLQKMVCYRDPCGIRINEYNPIMKSVETKK